MKTLTIKSALLLAACFFAAPSFSESFTVAGVTAASGEKASGYLSVAGEEGIKIPISVINGAHPGPVLVLVAGVHGYEYAPILALHRLLSELAPSRLSGTLLLVHMANPPGFFGRSIYINPLDNKNLNREFPGDPTGSVSQRIAHVITEKIVVRGDYLIDLHAGDGNEDLHPFVYMPKTGDPELDSGSRLLATSFGIQHVLIDRTPVQPADRSVYLDMTALSRGIPAITTETGALGVTSDDFVGLAVDGVKNVLNALDMADFPELPAKKIQWLEGPEVVRSCHDGLFLARVAAGKPARKGSLLGTIVNDFGEPIAEVKAPFTGMVNYVVATPPIKKGEPLAMLSRIKAE